MQGQHITASVRYTPPPPPPEENMNQCLPSRMGNVVATASTLYILIELEVQTISNTKGHIRLF